MILILVIPCLSIPLLAKSELNLNPQVVVNNVDIEFIIAGPNAHGEDYLTIQVSKVENNDTKAAITSADAVLSKYHIYSDIAGTILVKSGDLSYTNNKWVSGEIALAWTGSGTFYVTVEFKTAAMTNSAETPISESGLHIYQRANIMEPIMIAIIIVGSILGTVIIIIAIRIKKAGVSVERKKKEPKGLIKTREISKDELKKAKKEKKKKEKGKTEVKEDLIFSVPQWEVDDDDDE